MNVEEQIKKLKEFLESYYQAKLLERVRKGFNSISIDFLKLIKFSPNIADSLLEEPSELIKAFEIAVEEFDLPKDTENFRVRIKNLPESQTLKIKNVRAKHLDKFLSITGVVRQKSDVRPQVTSARFECPSCGNVINVLQLDSKFQEPTKCGCGRKGRFRLLSKELIDAQGIVLEEAPEDLEGGEQPKRINVFLKEDLVSPISERKTNPGSKILINGSITEVPVILRSGSQSTRFDLLLQANYIEPVDESFMDIVLKEEEIEKIKELSQDPKIYQKLTSSAAPSIYGYEKVKESLLIQLVGGVRKERNDGIKTRGDIHILLIGDPGAGKSALLRRMAIVAPKARLVTGKGASGAGLTAAVVKDEFLQGWALEAGALVLANHGICCIDELDKMTKEDRSAMHEALEQQTVSISKANIQATLRCETTVLAAANPKFGRFDPYDIIANQIDLPPALINRFDLIFPIKDMPDETKDNLMAKHILSLHQNVNLITPEIETDLLKKYLIYARKNIKPKLTDSAIEEIRRYYVKVRSSGSEEGGVKSVPISARQLEALVRMTEAYAKLRLADKATKKDAKKAIELLHFCLSKIGVDPETGKIDIDRISSGITASQRSRIFNIKDIISELENKLGKIIPINELIEKAKQKGIDEDTVEEVIEKLKRSGDLFEPKRGFISKV